MGGSGRQRPIGIAGGLAGILLLVAACGGGSPAIGDLLLGPEDFSGQAVTRTGIQVGQAASGEPTAYVKLTGPGFSLQHSLVKFDSEGSARAALAAVKQQWEQLARANHRFTLVQPELAQLRVSGRELVSGVLVEIRGEGTVSTLIFVEGRALVRMTISGDAGRALLPAYAEKARIKAGH